MAKKVSPNLLNEDQERAFRSWHKSRAKKFGVSQNPDDPRNKYDYRAAFLAGAEPDSTGHWPSEHKVKGHPAYKVKGMGVVGGQGRRRG